MPKNILVIDDEEILSKTFTLLLKKTGYGVFTARSCEEALVLVEKETLHLAVCDMRMPGVSGVETVKRITQKLRSAGKKELPVIFITGYADPNLEQEARSLNPVAFFYKPFDTLEMLNLIRANV